MDQTGHMATSDGNSVILKTTVPGSVTDIFFGSTDKASISTGEKIKNARQPLLDNFNNPFGLTALEGNLLRKTCVPHETTIGSAGKDGLRLIISRTLELSNVNVTNETMD